MLNNKIYIGKHQTEDPNDRYFGSGRVILEAIKKYGKENFVKTVLHVYDNENEMNLKEVEIITKEFINRPDTYNIGVGGEGGPHFKGKKHSEETVNHLKKLRANYPPITEETRKKLRAKRKPCSEETKRKISETRLKRIAAGLIKN